MFTGIVTDCAELSWLDLLGAKGRLAVTTTKPLPEMRLGDSVAVNGCCLTVVEILPAGFVVDLSDETLRKTAFARMQKGDWVNLEWALKVGDRLGGHWVLGHVDGTGIVERIEENAGSIAIVVRHPLQSGKYIVDKGSITVDGISLTVSKLAAEHFAVHIIPHTWQVTNLSRRRQGDLVHLEFDILGKYVESLMYKEQQHGS